MDELSPGARALLAAAEMSDDPTTEDAARVRRAVLANVGALGATAALVTTSTAQAKAASLLSVGAKLAAALAITAGGVAATWSYVHQQTSEAVVTGPARPQVAPPPSAPVTPRDTPAEPALPEPEPQVEAPPSKALHPAPRAPRTTEKPDSAPSKPDVAVANLEAEMKLIRGADSALRAGRASEALALLAKHQAEHPHASLAHEREGLRAIAQCQTGASGSREVAERFLARSPRSPLAPRLRSACRIQE